VPEASYRHATVLTLTAYGQNDANTADAVSSVLTCQEKQSLSLKILVSHKKRPTFD